MCVCFCSYHCSSCRSVITIVVVKKATKKVGAKDLWRHFSSCRAAHSPTSLSFMLAAAAIPWKGAHARAYFSFRYMLTFLSSFLSLSFSRFHLFFPFLNPSTGLRFFFVISSSLRFPYAPYASSAHRRSLASLFSVASNVLHHGNLTDVDRSDDDDAHSLPPTLLPHQQQPPLLA